MNAKEELIEAKAALTEMFEALVEVEDALDDIFDGHIPEEQFSGRAFNASRIWVEPILYPWGICRACDARVATAGDLRCDDCRL